MKTEKFLKWESSKFAPEQAFLNTVSKIPGVTNVETQTYTFATVAWFKKNTFYPNFF